jgi:hypothetical protein
LVAEQASLLLMLLMLLMLLLLLQVVAASVGTAVCSTQRVDFCTLTLYPLQVSSVIHGHDIHERYTCG